MEIVTMQETYGTTGSQARIHRHVAINSINLRLTLYYWWNELKPRSMAFSFRLSLLIIIFSALLSFTLFLPAYQYWRVSPFNHSAYDFYVNGAITNEHYDAVANHEDTTQATVAWRLSPMTVYARGKAARAPALLHIYDHLADSSHAWLPPATRLHGQEITNDGAGQAIVSYHLARDLRLQPGDTITMPIQLLQTSVSFTVAAIHEPTDGGVRALVAVQRTPELHAILSALSSLPIRGHDLFISSKNPQSTRSFLEQLFSTEQVMLFSREEQINYQKASIEYRPPVVVAISLLGLLGYLLVTWRNALASLAERSRNIAILHSLGMPFGFILRVIFLEQVLSGVIIVAFAGFIALTFVYGLFLGNFLYLPPLMLYQFTALGLVSHILLVGILLWYMRRQLDRMPVSTLLAPGMK